MPRRPPSIPRSLASLAYRQEGLVSIQQCARHGLSGQQASESVNRGSWQRVARGVYDLTDLVPLPDRNEIDRRRRQAALLGALAHPGAIVTGVCALVLHEIQGAPTDITPEVAFPNGSPRRQRPEVRLRRITSDHWLAMGDIAFATVPDALAQAVPMLDRRHAVALMDSALQQRRLSATDLLDAHDDTRFRPGVHRTHAWWGECDARAESPAETWARLACADAGIPADMLQLPVLDANGRPCARVDLAWFLPDGRWLLVEIDGREAHDSPSALFHDRSRQNSILTGRTIMRRYTGAEAWQGTLATELAVLLTAAGWRPGLPCPDHLQL